MEASQNASLGDGVVQRNRKAATRWRSHQRFWKGCTRGCRLGGGPARRTRYPLLLTAARRESVEKGRLLPHGTVRAKRLAQYLVRVLLGREGSTAEGEEFAELGLR